MEYYLAVFGMALTVLGFLTCLVLWLMGFGSDTGSTSTNTTPSKHCDRHCRVVSSMDLGYTYSAVTYDIDHSQACMARASEAHKQAKKLSE